MVSGRLNCSILACPAPHVNLISDGWMAVRLPRKEQSGNWTVEQSPHFSIK